MPRPHLLAAALTMMCLSLPAHAISCVKPHDLSSMRAGVVSEINAMRKAHGLKPLVLSPKLERAAQNHACDMAWQRTYTHVGSDGSDLKRRVKRAGYRLRIAAENTARGFTSPEGVVDFWMHSPGHRYNILLPQVRQIGLGQAYTDSSGGKRHWVLVVGAER